VNAKKRLNQFNEVEDMANEKQKYSDKLKDPRWQKKRLQIMERDNWCCLVLPHQHDISAGLIKWILSSPEIMNELLTKYFDYLHQKAREKEGK
jgi:hypothetical protein